MSTDTRLRFNKKLLENVPLPPLGSRSTFHDSEVPGLQVRVTDRGVKSFCVFRRSKRGVPERITIGRFPTLSVERAPGVPGEPRRHLGHSSTQGRQVRRA